MEGIRARTESQLAATLAPMSDAFELDSTYVLLRDGGQATTTPGGREFWATISERRELDTAWLVTRFAMNEDWDQWEMHPEGEELVILLSGRVDLLLDDGVREWKVELRPGQTTINPRGAWHRALVHEPSELMFVTAGKGTQHRPV